MKVFYCSLIIFILLLGAMAWNFQYVNRTCDRMEALAVLCESPADRQEGIRALKALWEEVHPALSLSICHLELDRISEQLLSLEAYAAAEDETETLHACRLLVFAIEDARRLESLSFHNII